MSCPASCMLYPGATPCLKGPEMFLLLTCPIGTISCNTEKMSGPNFSVFTEFMSVNYSLAYFMWILLFKPDTLTLT